MARKPFLPLVFLIASIFIVNTCNCQGEFLLSFAEPSLVSFLEAILTPFGEILCPIFYLLPESVTEPLLQTFGPFTYSIFPDYQVPYPLNVKKKSSIKYSPEPPFLIHYQTSKIFKFSKGFIPQSQIPAGPSGGQIYLTGELVKDQKYPLLRIDIVWNNDYPKPYTVDDKTNPYGQITFSFRSPGYENPENKGNCSLIVNIVLYIEKKGTTVDPKYQPFLDMIREVKDAHGPFATFEPDQFLEPFKSIIEKPYFLYTANYTMESQCANFIVYPQTISIPESEFTNTGSFGSSSAKNTFTPTTKCSKLVKYVESGIKLKTIG